MMTTVEHHNSSYQVVVLGELAPAVLAFCARLPAHNETSGVFRVQAGDGQDIEDRVAMMQGAGLTILSIRELTGREARTEPEPVA
jgi:hypothetical protein